MITLICLVFGLVLGYLIGYAQGCSRLSASNEELRAELNALNGEEVPVVDASPPQKRFNLSFSSAIEAMVVVVLLFSLGSTAYTLAKLETSADRSQRVSHCVNSVMSEFLTALDERTKYTEATTTRLNDVIQAERQFLAVVASGNARSEDLQLLLSTIDKYQKAQEDADTSRAQFPYPDKSDLDACIQ